MRHEIGREKRIMSDKDVKLRLEHIAKTFANVKATDDVSFEVRRGEVLGVVGVNGAGKSTLMNIIGGVLRPDSGRIMVDNQPVVFHSPKDAERHGIAFIHQELLSFESQTVAENIFIGRLFERTRLRWIVDKRKGLSEAKKYLSMLGSDISPSRQMESLSVGGRQVVEIARALTLGAEVIIFDEPTSSLSAHERDSLFRTILALRDEGRAIVYISHFLDEIKEICDRFVVLRNGRICGDGRVEDTSKSEIVRMIIGREAVFERKESTLSSKRPAFQVERLETANVLHDIRFTLHEGEILGIWGLLGSGRTELLRGILGFDPTDIHELSVWEQGQRRRMKAAEFRRECGYVTESRQSDGLFLKRSVAENISAATLTQLASGPLSMVATARESESALALIEKLRIAVSGPDVPVSTLSGGNQQKVVIAKWIKRNPRFMMMDEPTRGVDVGAKMEIGALIRELAGQGMPVLLVTSDLEEMISLADRVIVMRNGRIVGEAEGERISGADLTMMCLGEMSRG
jgi:ABC-type sugar transport system ATPase subunit